MQYVSPEFLDSAKSHIVKSRYDSSGCDCIFFKFGSVGIKAFSFDHHRDCAYKLQKLGSIFGVGPKCWHRFDMQGYHCFFTEIAEIRSDIPGGYHSQEECEKHRENKQKLRENLAAIGMVCDDFHDENWGYIGERPVLIDFGTGMQEAIKLTRYK